jgi:hypothetical protein
VKKGSIVALQWGGGAFVGKVTASFTQHRIFYKPLDGKKLHDGTEYSWGVFEVNYNEHTRESETLRYAWAEYECDAKNLVKLWQDEFQAQKTKEMAMARDYAKGIEKLTTRAPVPEQCDPISKFDISDQSKGWDSVLRQTYPKVFECFDRLKAATSEKEKEEIRKDLEKSYVLDVVAIAGAIPDEHIPGDISLVMAISAIIKNREHSKGKNSQVIQRRQEILRGWFKDKYCFLSHSQRAACVNKSLGTQYSVEDIRSDLRALGLVTKRKSGPPETEGWKK